MLGGIVNWWCYKTLCTENLNMQWMDFWKDKTEEVHFPSFPSFPQHASDIFFNAATPTMQQRVAEK